MKISLYFLLLLSFIFSCTTPEKALKKHHYNQAFNLSKREIRKGKNVEKNMKILRESSKVLIERTISKNEELLNSDDVEDWIKVRKSYYKTLEKIGKANYNTNGALSDIYDILCEPKTDLDEKIATTFYNQGNVYMNQYDKSEQKIDAQNAYYQYDECIKNGGTSFFTDVLDLKNESLELGIVYYQSRGRYYHNSLFLRPLPPDADFDADCLVDITLGFIDTNISENTSTNTYTQDVVVENRITTDTSGNTITTPIYESVSCTVETTTVTIKKSQSVNIHATDQTGQCSISNRYYTVSVSDNYEIVSIDGDERALPSGIEEKDAPTFFERDLENKLEDEVIESY